MLLVDMPDQKCRGNEIKILLWGARAHEFAAEDVRAASIESAVVAIFVGTLPKMSQGIHISQS